MSNFSCIQCNKVEVSEEYTRCESCSTSHQQLVKQLDSRPKVIEKKVKEELFSIKRMRGGIECVDWISREDAINMGIKV